MDDAHTEQPDPVASEVPPAMLFALAVPVFAVMAWGMMLLAGHRPYRFESQRLPQPEVEPRDPTDP